MKWKAIGVLLGVFLLGIGSGILVDRVVLWPYGPRLHPPHHHGQLLHRLATELDLSPEQQEKIEAILATTRTELGTLRQQTRRQVRAVLSASEDQIKVFLQPKQRDAFQKLLAEHHARHERGRQRRWQRWYKQP